MTFCLVMLGVFMLFGYFSQKHSEKLAVAQGRAWGPDEHGVYARLEVWSVALILIVVFVCGLRIKYNDTGNYIGGFLASPTLGEIFGTPMTWGDCPGFLYLQAAVRSVTDNPHLFIMLCAAINVAPVLIFLKKYSNNFFFTMFLYVAAGQFLFSLAALKQAIAIAIAIWAIPLYLKKKYLAALVVLMLAALFHPYVLSPRAQPQPQLPAACLYRRALHAPPKALRRRNRRAPLKTPRVARLFGLGARAHRPRGDPQEYHAPRTSPAAVRSQFPLRDPSS